MRSGPGLSVASVATIRGLPTQILAQRTLTHRRVPSRATAPPCWPWSDALTRRATRHSDAAPLRIHFRPAMRLRRARAECPQRGQRGAWHGLGNPRCSKFTIRYRKSMWRREKVTHQKLFVVRCRWRFEQPRQISLVTSSEASAALLMRRLFAPLCAGTRPIVFPTATDPGESEHVPCVWVVLAAPIGSTPGLPYGWLTGDCLGRFQMPSEVASVGLRRGD
jgi:hypothetical protein